MADSLEIKSSIRKVGVVGCGLMGSQYAQLCAQIGYEVLVCDTTAELLEGGLNLIHGRLADDVSQGTLPQDEKDAILSRISGTTNLSEFSICDIVVEAVTEKLEVKQAVFDKLDRVCAKDIVLATNTSVLSVMDIAKVTQRPGKVVGIHMAPLLFPMAEVIQTIATTQETLDIALRFARSLGKLTIVAKDMPGFIINRLLTPVMLGAIRMVQNGVASRDDIDGAFTKGVGWPMGPLAMADGVGLDTLLSGTESIYDDEKNPEFIAPILLKKMVAAGWLGVKTSKGFYEYGS